MQNIYRNNIQKFNKDDDFKRQIKDKWENDSLIYTLFSSREDSNEAGNIFVNLHYKWSHYCLDRQILQKL